MTESKEEIEFLLNKLVSRKKIQEKERKNDIANSLGRLDLRNKPKSKAETQTSQQSRDEKYSNRFGD